MNPGDILHIGENNTPVVCFRRYYSVKPETGSVVWPIRVQHEFNGDWEYQHLTHSQIFWNVYSLERDVEIPTLLLIVFNVPIKGFLGFLIDQRNVKIIQWK
jgi:hypothetical protein